MIRMKKKTITKILIANLLFIGNVQADINSKRKGCPIPDILIETVMITENETMYPYFIRTNSKKTLDTFWKIVDTFPYKKTKENMVIDCLNKENCESITQSLVNNNINDIDLGLHQINYQSFPDKRLEMYFNPNLAYYKACAVVIEKIKIKKKWDWEVFAGYHSFTEKLNLEYKKKLIKNFIKIAKKRGYEIPTRERL